MEKNEPVISIIVPVYNVEKYLDRCVESLLRQSYGSIEIILVDDGSTDSSPEICDGFSSAHPNILTIHKKNGGAGSARNAGIEAASGEFITFVDSDDWVAGDIYEYAASLMALRDADAVEVDFAMVRSEEEKVPAPTEKVKTYGGKDILRYYMRSSSMTGSYSLCRCLFRRKVLEGIRFREGRINEDIDFKYAAFERCGRITVSNQPKYFYFQSEGSVSTVGLKIRDYDLYEAMDLLCEMTRGETYGGISRLADAKRARVPLSLLCRMAYYGIADAGIDKKETAAQLTKELRRNLGTLLLSPMPFSRKILAVLFSAGYGVAERCVKLAKKARGGNVV